MSGVPVRAAGEDEAVRRVKGVPGPAPAAAGRKRVRLTRRGRLVLTSGIVLLIVVASMVAASAAQAAIHP